MKDYKPERLIRAFVVPLLGLTWLSTVSAGQLEPPASAVDGSGNPVPTMRSMDEVLPTWSQLLPDSDRYVSVMNDGAVLDKETGIVWAKSLYISFTGDIALMSWSNAEFNCQGVNIAGRRGWRLPTFREVNSIGDINHKIPLAMFDAANLAGQGFFWTSTEVNSDPSKAYVYSVSATGSLGHISLDKVNDTAALWCVRTPVGAW
jgi:hypothetical protein